MAVIDARQEKCRQQRERTKKECEIGPAMLRAPPSHGDPGTDLGESEEENQIDGKQHPAHAQILVLGWAGSNVLILFWNDGRPRPSTAVRTGEDARGSIGRCSSRAVHPSHRSIPYPANL